MTKKKLGGYGDTLVVEKVTNGYFFRNYRYGMEMYVHQEDIKDVLLYPMQRIWGNSRSWRNDVDNKDRAIILDYLKNKTYRYKTVSDLMKSRSKYKKKYLMQFSMDELQEYIKKKEDNEHVKVESCS